MSSKKGITARKMKFSIKDFFSKCDQIHSFLRIWSHLLKRSLMENVIFFIFFCLFYFYLLIYFLFMHLFIYLFIYLFISNNLQMGRPWVVHNFSIKFATAVAFGVSHAQCDCPEGQSICSYSY